MVYARILIVIFFFFSKSKVMACGLLQTNGNLINLTQSAKDIEKVTHINSAKANAAEYCETNMALRYINANSEAAENSKFQCTEMNKDELRGYLDKTFRAADDLSPWTTSLIQTASAQNFSLIKSAKVETDFNQASQELNFKNALEKIKLELSKSPRQVFKKKSDVSFHELSKDKMPNYLVKSVVCADLSFKNTFGCANALSDAIKIAAPVNLKIDSTRSTFLTPIKVWNILLTQEMKYAEGLRIASSKMIDNLIVKDTSSKNVLSDLIDSFKQAGISQSESEDAAFNILALYGNGGANLGFRAQALCHSNCKDVPGVPYYLEIIGKAIPRLDYERSKKKLPLYSWPNGVSGFCNTQKSYHFWMSAYVSREILKLGYSAESSMLGTYAAAIGYQLNRDQGRTSEKNKNYSQSVATRTAFDPVVNIMRADLAYAAAGAKYGSEYEVASRNSISIDSTLFKMMEHSSSKEHNSSFFDRIDVYKKAKNYNDFKGLLAPSAAIED